MQQNFIILHETICSTTVFTTIHKNNELLAATVQLVCCSNIGVMSMTVNYLPLTFKRRQIEAKIS